MENSVIGIDIGGTHFRIGTVGEDGGVSDFRKLPVRQVFCTSDPMQDLCDYLTSYCAGQNPKAFSIGFPATLDAQRKIVLQAPNVEFMEMLPIVDTLSKRFVSEIFIDRDVTMALRYDFCHYRIPTDGIVCGFYFGTGIGNAIFINGLPLVGRNGTAGELGHIPFDGSNALCGCGNQGCAEALAGGKYLMQLCETVYKGTPIDLLFEKHSTEPLLRQFIDRMAMVVATEVNILNPHYILIGGGVPAMQGFPGERFLERILLHTRRPFPAQDLHIIFTEDNDQKSVIGAAIHARSLMK